MRVLSTDLRLFASRTVRLWLVPDEQTGFALDVRLAGKDKLLERR
jgi:hypothetical protein